MTHDLPKHDTLRPLRDVISRLAVEAVTPTPDKSTTHKAPIGRRYDFNKLVRSLTAGERKQLRKALERIE